MEKMKYKIIASDLDGTLLNSRSEVGEKNFTAISSLRERGIYFVPATGRTYAEIPDEIKACADIRYFILSNGALVLDKLCDEKIHFCINKSNTLRLYGIISRYDAHLTARHDGKSYAEPLTEEGIEHHFIDENHVRVLKRYAIFPDDFSNVINTVEYLEVVSAYFHSNEERMMCKAEIEEGGEIRAVLVGKYGLEIFSAAAGKGAALLALCDKLGIKREEAIGVGDSGNDLSLIEAAGVGLAVKNATDTLIAAADRVICSNDDGVVAYILEGFCSQ